MKLHFKFDRHAVVYLGDIFKSKYSFEIYLYLSISYVYLVITPSTVSNEDAPQEHQTKSTAQVGISFGNPLKMVLTKVDELSKLFGTPQTTIIKSLIDNPCEYSARHQIESPSYSSNQKFDPYFSTKHDFEKNRFVQRLSATLRQHGVQAFVTTEQRHIVGVFDVLISNSKFFLTISNKAGKKIVVEWKSGGSFSLSQLERYLWECDVLVLVRVQMRQVVKLARNDIEGYLTRSLVALTERALAITSANNMQKIPGPYCKGCPVEACEFYKQAAPGKIVTYSSQSMEQDLLSIFNNLDHCIDAAVKVIIKELTA